MRHLEVRHGRLPDGGGAIQAQRFQRVILPPRAVDRRLRGCGLLLGRTVAVEIDVIQRQLKGHNLAVEAVGGLALERRVVQLQHELLQPEDTAGITERAAARELLQHSGVAGLGRLDAERRHQVARRDRIELEAAAEAGRIDDLAAAELARELRAGEQRGEGRYSQPLRAEIGGRRRGAQLPLQLTHPAAAARAACSSSSTPDTFGREVGREIGFRDSSGAPRPALVGWVSGTPAS